MKRLLTVVAGAALLTGCSLQPNDHTLPGQTAVGGDGYTVTVTFDDVENLVANSTVQRDDVTIGTVAKITVEDWQARVTLRLLKSVRIPQDATFSIGQKTLLGAQYVEVTEPPRAGAGEVPADGDVLADGDEIPVAQTGSYPQTEQILGAASLLLNNGGLSQISTITGQLNRTLDGRVPDTRSLVRRLDDLLGVLDDNKAAVVRALDSLDRLSETLAGERGTVARALREIGPGLSALNQERQALVTAVLRTGDLSVRAGRVVATNEEAILANVRSLRPVLARLGEVSSQLPEALKIAITVPFPVMTTDRAVRGDYANLFATVDVSLSALLANFARLGLPVPPELEEAAAAEKAAGAESDMSIPRSDGDAEPPAATPTSEPEKDCSVLATLLGGCR